MDIGADIDWLRGKIFLKPEDQLQLTEVVCMFSLLKLHIYYVFSNLIFKFDKILGITRRIC